MVQRKDSVESEFKAMRLWAKLVDSQFFCSHPINSSGVTICRRSKDDELSRDPATVTITNGST